MIACLEEIAYRMGFITARDLAGLAESMHSSEYGQYLFRVIEDEMLGGIGYLADARIAG